MQRMHLQPDGASCRCGDLGFYKARVEPGTGTWALLLRSGRLAPTGLADNQG